MTDVTISDAIETDQDGTKSDGNGDNKPVPFYIEFLYPIMLIMSDGSSRNSRQITAVVADMYFGIDVKGSDSPLIPKLISRVNSALYSLEWNGMIETHANSKFYNITPVGRMLLNRYPSGLKGRELFKNPEFESLETSIHALKLIEGFENESKSGLPQYVDFMAPVLSVLSDGIARPFQKVVDDIATELKVTEAQLIEASGTLNMSLLSVRVDWAVFVLFKMNAVECLTLDEYGSYTTLRSVFQITDLGRATLREKRSGFNPELVAHDLSLIVHELLKVVESKEASEDEEFSIESKGTSSGRQAIHGDPTRQIDSAIELINSRVSAELLKIIHEGHPYAFESIVVELLMAMGYGDKGDGRRIGGSGDGGVDGVINQDKLGLDQIYIQAKRYAPNNPVGRPDIQGFVGALAGKGASRGVFITTSRFSPGAEAYAKSIPARIILIDGKKLAELMIQYRVGVQIEDTHVVVGVDKDFFD